MEPLGKSSGLRCCSGLRRKLTGSSLLADLLSLSSEVRLELGASDAAWCSSVPEEMLGSWCRGSGAVPAIIQDHIKAQKKAFVRDTGKKC